MSLPETVYALRLTGLTMAEKFRDEGRDVLLFIDNIYRYTRLREPRYLRC